jgi:hypothetical protein
MPLGEMTTTIQLDRKKRHFMQKTAVCLRTLPVPRKIF